MITLILFVNIQCFDVNDANMLLIAHDMDQLEIRLLPNVAALVPNTPERRQRDYGSSK